MKQQLLPFFKSHKRSFTVGVDAFRPFCREIATAAAYYNVDHWPPFARLDGYCEIEVEGLADNVDRFAAWLRKKYPPGSEHELL